MVGGFFFAPRPAVDAGGLQAVGGDWREKQRKAPVRTYGEFGWVLKDNLGTMSIAQPTGADVNKVYRIYERAI